MSRPAILYISYDGMLEPLGQSQVLSYLEGLAGTFEINLLSFEKKADTDQPEKLAAVRRRIEAAGISWTRLRYHKSPTAPATAWDISLGTMIALGITVRRRVRIIHARSYIPALIGLAVKRATGARLLFDMRGLWADERVDAGIWSRAGRLYRSTKSLERTLLLGADQIVTLTHASAREIASFPYMASARAPVTVIPTCADLDRFRRQDGRGGPAFTYGFVGAATTWSLFSEVLRSFEMILARRPDAKMLVVNRNEHAFIRNAVRESGVPEARVEIVAAEHSDVPAYLSRMDVAAALRKPTYSQVACAPTKLGEYLGCGIPCLVNTGIGDVVDLIQGEHVGAVAASFSEADLEKAVTQLLEVAAEPGIRDRCVDAARRHFSLTDGIAGYRRIYDALLAPREAAA